MPDTTPEIEETACPLCGAQRHEDYLCAPDLLCPRRTAWRFVRCAECRLVYLNPRPTREAMHAHYPENSYYAYAERPHYTPPQVGTLRRALRDFILREHFGYRHMALDRGLTLCSTAAGRCLVRAATGPLKGRFSYALPWRGSGRLLDVGCGSGEYLAVQRELGWQVAGVEMSSAAARFGRERLGLPVVEGGIEESAFPDGAFDVVRFNHSLEHIHNPLAAARKAYRLLREGGQLRVAVPNGASIGARLLGPLWRGYDPPRHLTVFTHSTLAALVERAGFRGLRVRPAMSAAGAFLAGVETLLRESRGTSIRLRHVRPVSLPFGILYRSLIPARWTGHLLLTAEK